VAASSRDDLIPDEMEVNDGRLLSVLKVAGNGIADHGFQLFERICLCENGRAQSSGFVAAFRRFLNGKMISLLDMLLLERLQLFVL
jgi:hypothetical protein